MSEFNIKKTGIGAKHDVVLDLSDSYLQFNTFAIGEMTIYVDGDRYKMIVEKNKVIVKSVPSKNYLKVEADLVKFTKANTFGDVIE